MPEANAQLAMARWRLILGRFAEDDLGAGLRGRGDYTRMDRVLDYLYGHEYASRGVRTSGDRDAGLGESILTVPTWIREVRELFPTETVELVVRHALQRYEMTALVTDPEVLEKLEPSYDLMKALLTFRGMMEGAVLDKARALIRWVVEDLTRRLTREVRAVLWGRLNRNRPTRSKCANNLDWRRTIRANLKSYDPEKRRLVLESVFFSTRQKNYMPWHIIMAIDCSGSMIDSVIHSAVMAGIFAGLPSVRVSLVAFDTAVVDLSDYANDPTSVLMSVQLGGGTDIAGAVGYCEKLVHNPTRTIFVLVTDFCEGGSAGNLIAGIHRFREAGVKVLGLASLDAEAQPAYDRQMAQRCADAGAEIAALTPMRLAEWLEKALS